MKRILVVPLLLLFPLLTPAQNKIAVRPIGQSVIAFSATPVFDASQSNSFKLVLTGNVTSSTVIGMEAGQELTFEICQDGVGARTFAWPGLMVGPITILAGINVCTVETFHYDGTSATIWTTTTAGGGGSGTVNSGTAKCITWYAATGTTVSADCNIDDGSTNANGLTYVGVNGVYAAQFNSTASGALVAVGTEGTPGGAAAGKDVLACGDLTSHSCQISNNGDSFRSIALHQSTSPVVHGLMVAQTFPTMSSLSRGAQGQPLLEGSVSGDPGYGQLDLSLSTNVINRLAKANQTASTVYNDQANTFTAAGTLDASASTVASAVRVPNGAGLTTAINGAFGYDTTNNMAHLGMNGADSRLVATTITPTDTFCAQWTRTSGHYELGQASGTCGTPGGAGALSGITAAIGANSINNGDNPQTWNFSLTTAGRRGFKITENVASTCTGACYLWDFSTIASSTANPWISTAVGTVNGIHFQKTGFLGSVGTGGVDSSLLHCDVTTATKCLLFGLSGITSATTRTWTIQDSNDTFVGRATTDTLTNKTLTAPVISTITNTGTLTLPTSTDTLTGRATTDTLTNKTYDTGGTGNVFKAAGSQGTTGQVLRATTGAGPNYIDFPDFHYFPAADCVNAVAASGWSTGATPAATCRAGTNNKEGYLLWGASDTGQMSIGLPADWDTGTAPSVRLRLASTDATAGHTIIMQLATACSKGDGTTTDDVAFNAVQSFSTVTLVATANQQWDATLSSITTTGCAAGGVLRLKLSRTTDTATNVEVYGLGITIPRLLAVQAN